MAGAPLPLLVGLSLLHQACMLLLGCGNGGVWCRRDQQQGSARPWVLTCFWDGALRPAASWKRAHA